ncbi:MAG: site-2 protease family protein [Dehalococcoidia bacterium]|nr:site-2 protease family protein [Dehalococcoidia bacterium]
MSRDPAAFFSILAALVITLLIGFTLHEFSHGVVAYRLGDRTAQRAGRLTLNPLAHLDPMGTLLLLLAGFGWAKPVPINPYAMRIGPKLGMALTAAAGPVTNLVIAGLAGLPLKMGLVTSGAPELLLVYMVVINIILAVFNLIPLAPLDGFKVALGLLPQRAAASFARLEPWGPGILLVVLLIGFVTPYSPLSAVLDPFLSFFSRAFTGAEL